MSAQIDAAAKQVRDTNDELTSARNAREGLENDLATARTREQTAFEAYNSAKNMLVELAEESE